MPTEFFHREKIGTEFIVSDGKVFDEGVERKRNMLKNGEDIGDVLVVKHPKSHVYAVLDGHHAFEAYKSEGVKEIECLVIDDHIGLLFELTKEGRLQPGSKYTQYVRVPFKKSEEYLKEFFEDPEKMLKKQSLMARRSQ
jgi:hypothetical protein